MAILPNNYYTLIDLATQFDPEGRLLDLVDMLSQDNEILLDIPWTEANMGMKHRTNVVTGLPAAFWRQYNQGVPLSKGTTAPLEETCAMLQVYSRIDRDLAQLNGMSAGWRLNQERMFVSGMSQQMASTLFYGNQETTLASFTGFSPRYSTITPANSANAVNVIDGLGRGTTNTSIWLIGWGPGGAYGIYPKGSAAGLQVKDVTTEAPVQDANGNYFQALSSQYKWDCGLASEDWRRTVRIANIDTTQLTGTGALNIISAMIAAANKVPAMPRTVTAVQTATEPVAPITAIRPVFYVNRTIRTALELQVLNKSNLLLQLQEYDGMPVLTFRGIPIRTCDCLLNTEAALS